MSRVVRPDSAGGSGSSGSSCLSHSLNARGFSGPSCAGGPSAPSGHSSVTSPSRSSALSGLSDRELLARVKKLVSQERAVMLEILVHLIEVERRKLHLRLGYPSLFEYCTRHLGYSSSAAGRRIHAARCVRDFPEVYELLEKNEVTLITVSLVASILNESNRKDLLGRIRNKSQREVESIVAVYRPPISMRDRARPVSVVVSEAVARELVNSGHLCPLTPSAGSEISPNVAADSAGGLPRDGTENRAVRAPDENVPPAHHDSSAVHDLWPGSAFPQPHPPHRTKAPRPIPRERSLHEEIRKSPGASLEQTREALVRGRPRDGARRVPRASRPGEQKAKT